MNTNETAIITKHSMAYWQGGKVRVNAEHRADVHKAVTSFLDAAAVATGQKTFYNSKEEQEKALVAVHAALATVDRGLYAALLCLPGVTDLSRQKGLAYLLDTPRPEDTEFLLNQLQENNAVALLARDMPPQRLFKMFGQFREKKINNRRTRRLILSSILGNARLPLWSVKYREKLRVALRHAWGAGVASGILKLTSITSTKRIDRLGLTHLKKYIDHYALDHSDEGLDVVYQCVCFILGGRRHATRHDGGFSVPVLAAFCEARHDLAKGAILPPEVLYGIRSSFHKTVPKEEVLKLTAASGSITEGQKLTMQRQAKSAGVDVGFDPRRSDAVKLYVYLMEMANQITAPEHQQIQEALRQKAFKSASTFPVRYGTVAIVIDDSASMFGAREAGKNRPMAVALALRDLLAATASQGHTVLYASGRSVPPYSTLSPQGDTALARRLIDAARHAPDAVYLITDGYENAPAGRVAEVVAGLRAAGCNFPIYQMTPVFGAETASVRTLAPGLAVLPVQRPEALGLSMIRAALSADVEEGIAALLGQTAPLLMQRTQDIEGATLVAESETPEEST